MVFNIPITTVISVVTSDYPNFPDRFKFLDKVKPAPSPVANNTTLDLVSTLDVVLRTQSTALYQNLILLDNDSYHSVSSLTPTEDELAVNHFPIPHNLAISTWENHLPTDSGPDQHA